MAVTSAVELHVLRGSARAIICRVSPLDWALALFVALVAVAGFLRGFLVGALTLGGFAGGALLGIRLGGALADEGAISPAAPLLGLACGLVGGGVLAGGMAGLGERLRRRISLPGFGAVDGLLGAALSAAVALGAAWLIGVAALQAGAATPLGEQVRRSAILGRLNAALPVTGPIIDALARFDPFPRLAGPRPDVGAPSSRIAGDPDVRAARASVVRIVGSACGRGVSGSGWVAPGGLVITNAHVVAGQDDPEVVPAGEVLGLPATVVALNRGEDVAVLRVPGLDAPALRLADRVVAGTPAAVLGFPGGGPYAVRAARLGDTRAMLTRDGSGGDLVGRRITTFRATVRPGNSGGPVVDADGAVAATVFAARTGDGPRSGFGVPNETVRAVLARAGPPVATSACFER
jgi:S1-C subfamily serine protease